jgi:hypothetical protein
METLFPGAKKLKSSKAASATRGIRADSIKFYGSFTRRYPCELNNDSEAKLPKTMKISENANSENFDHKFYYFTFESQINIQISVLASSKFIPI